MSTAHAKSLLNARWLLNEATGLLFIENEYMINRDLKPYVPTVDEIVAGRRIDLLAPEVKPFEPADPAPAQAIQTASVSENQANDRAATIRAAVASIPAEQYGKAGFGFPAMPKVEAVEAATGLADVTREEIKAALPAAAE